MKVVGNSLWILIIAFEWNLVDFLVYLLFFQSSRTATYPINFSNSSRDRDHKISFYKRVGLRADVSKLNCLKVLFYYTFIAF